MEQQRLFDMDPDALEGKAYNLVELFRDIKNLKEQLKDAREMVRDTEEYARVAELRAAILEARAQSETLLETLRGAAKGDVVAIAKSKPAKAAKAPAKKPASKANGKSSKAATAK